MTTYRVEKIAISLTSRAAEQVRRAVRHGRAKSVSAYIVQAIEEKEKSYSLGWLDEIIEKTGGPMTAAEKRRVDKILGIKPKRRRPPKRGR